MVDVIPVDLNAILFRMEVNLAKIHSLVRLMLSGLLCCEGLAVGTTHRWLFSCSTPVVCEYPVVADYDGRPVRVRQRGCFAQCRHSSRAVQRCSGAVV